jgi:hypothetical protein
MITDIIMYGLALLILVLIILAMINNIRKPDIVEVGKLGISEYDKQEPLMYIQPSYTEILKEIHSILNESNMHLRSMCRVMDETVKEELGSQIQAKEDIEESNKTSYVEPVKESPKENMVKSIKWYNNTVQKFLEIKRETLESDNVIRRRVGLSDKALKTYIKPYQKEYDELKKKCQEKTRKELSDRLYKKGR